MMSLEAPTLLWIAFRLYLWLIEHNLWHVALWHLAVVNCFQIVSLTYWTQLSFEYSIIPICCELLSDCIFDLLNTTCLGCYPYDGGLWIAFRLYLWLIEHNRKTALNLKLHVVNCFQIVSLTYWTQQHIESQTFSDCCELLSDCIFDLLNTTSSLDLITIEGLWIAFRLYLWLIEHNCLLQSSPKAYVVNCFQIVSLTYWTQPS